MNLSQDILSADRPFLIAGPCSVETEEQLFTVCRELAANKKVKVIRGGIWKPRTRPDSFEGIGTIGLPWIQAIKQEINLPFAVEVATPKHVEAALKAGIDILWIGARTTVNPFAVQDIADALKGTQIPVMIKNPINPDLGLWLGAFERFQKVGIEDLTAIHRGFSVYHHPKYRNVPNWELPIGLKEHLPQIPMICDPSHITGNRELLLEVSQKAMDLNFDGLMIESHPNPDKAWSDAAQQLTPEALDLMLQKLVLRSRDLEDSTNEQLAGLRTKISNLDDQLFDILAARMKISDELGAFKRQHNLTILKEDHWKKIVQQRLENNSHTGLSLKFVREILDHVHQESIRHQTKVMNNDNSAND